MQREDGNTPKISVIMSVYNSERFLREAIESILNQTYKDFEFIILDDNSTDQSIEIVRGYDDIRIRFFQNERNLGLRDSLNKGLGLAKGEYIARMDSDDIADERRFEKQVIYMDNNPNVVLCGGNIRYLVDGKVRKNREIFPLTFSGIKIAFLRYNCFFHPTVFMRRNFLLENQLIYERTYADDYDLWIRIMKTAEKKNCIMTNMPDIFLDYRLHSSNFGKRKKEISKEVFQIQKEYIQNQDLTWNEKDMLLKGYEGNFVEICEIKNTGDILKQYRNKLNDNAVNNIEVQNILSQHYYELCYLYAKFGMSVFKLFCESKGLNHVNLICYCKLFLKCGFKGKIHKCNRI